MKILGNLLLAAIMLFLVGCASNNEGNINGNWTAALLESNGSQPVFNFNLTLAEMSGGGLSITNLNFTSATPCFVSGSTATGGFTLSGNMNGVTSGGFQMTIQSAGSATNVMTMQGTVSNNTISGTWTLSGTTSGCSGAGTFTMNRS
jgi:hypothetical protein